MFILKNCTISAGSLDRTKLVDISIEGEKISKIEPAGKRSLRRVSGVTVLDVKGCLALPGGIDPHVHFDTPGFESREDFAHGSAAAAAGGITTVIDMPCTSVPAVTSVKNLERKLGAIEQMAFVDFALWGGISQNLMREGSEGKDWFQNMEELSKAGVVGFKVYMISGMDGFRALNFIEMGQVLQFAKKLGAVVGIHAEDGRTIAERTEGLRRAGKNSLNDYYLSRAEPAEQNAVAAVVGLAKQTGAKAHVVHLASGAGAQLISWAKAAGYDVSAETCAHYLTFTHDDLERYGALIKTAPVVKEGSDRAALWQMLCDGAIDFLSSDHAPCPLKEKRSGNAWTDYGGMPGVQIMLPFAFSEGFKKGRISLRRLVEITSENAARRFGLYPRKGALAKGSDADIVIIDPGKSKTIANKDMLSKGKWTPFAGRKFDGRVEYTILRGKVAYSYKKGVAKKPQGKWIRSANGPFFFT